MDYTDESHQEEYAAEISPGYRQDIRKEESPRLSPLLMGAVVFGIIFIVLLISYLQ
ncbi:2-isopropylmalate synthase [Ectobacillus antri]|uniref:2-isopropylmalate synthase n=1 Tax=Ectobacillus antri TaxID=2486280 RepID=A0ABT6H4G6_9BACI|nr:2-isopropylmalate synthase [Ectobacillus antri]MDG4658379.1 2-isopropylmalate synthase [Ectobacillus antri]MDG5753713.1 2-isopropylmalate synthase [Ectobacillus antri]